MNGLGQARPTTATPLAGLRELLHEKFPTVEVRSKGVLATGLEDLDQSSGGLTVGVVTEMVGPTSAGAMLIETTLKILAREHCFGALVEAGDSFNPQDSDASALRRLLWVRSPSVMTAVRAVDLLLRDGNLRVLLLDLQTASMRELRRIPASTWHRFQRLVEVSNMIFIVLSSQPMVEAAKVRIAIPRRWTLQAMRERRRHLLQRLSAQVFERRQFPMWDARQKSA